MDVRLRHERRQRGYSLIELLIVLGILGLLASMAMPLAEMTVQREKERELKRALWDIRTAIDAYKKAVDQGAIVARDNWSGYPPTLTALTEPVTDARPDRRGATLRFLRRIPRDPFADPALPSEKGWGVRSFESAADQPRAAGDVYDVYSTSGRIGLNGVPVKEW